MPAKLDEAVAIASRFSRCANYPTTGKGMTQLAQGLIHASEVTGVLMAEIAQKCAEETEFCPTDALMLRVANGLKPYVLPESKPYPGPASCGICGGSGWQITYSLHTLEGQGEHQFRRKEFITERQANDLWPKLDTSRQMIYSGARRCPCGAVPPADRSIPR